MTTIKAILNKDREKKCGGYSLVIQVIHKRVRRVIYTPYILKESEFDPFTQKAIYTGGTNFTRKQIHEINNFIAGKVCEMNQVIETLSSCKKEYLVQDILWEYQHSQSERYLATFINQMIDKKEQLGKMGTAKALRSTRNSLERFTDKRMMMFNDIDHHFVKEYELYLHSTGVAENTVSFYLRNFRTIYNCAYSSGVDMVDHSPFHKITIRNAKTVKRALKLEVLLKLVNMDLSASPPLDRARDLFMFSFYTRGMSFVDIIYLQHSNIEQGIIRYCRHKTNQSMQVTITAPLQVLIDKYKGDAVYVLPLITTSNQPTLYQRYQSAYSNLYRHLKVLQEMLDLGTPLTTHVARHSWATLAKELGVPLAAISEGLGHTSEKTTGIYLKEFDTNVIDKINDRILLLFSSKKEND